MHFIMNTLYVSVGNIVTFGNINFSIISLLISFYSKDRAISKVNTSCAKHSLVRGAPLAPRKPSCKQITLNWFIHELYRLFRPIYLVVDLVSRSLSQTWFCGFCPTPETPTHPSVEFSTLFFEPFHYLSHLPIN